ncbi:SAM-dependent methyltransferase [Lipingzhangella sp. LS1_29]|uniref:SAM-dependent methyltransferase n=1 Tax=Lipingzhangella rawalii TaxID=2055835 RepID=A0ABU2H6Q8_9ACTN|nr:SAM-dependent methyltransferase [Lipingzhangella rawalii]MDS1270534.1 SAM-dependent methyltransferase [Lipingzhangella rawalii]
MNETPSWMRNEETSEAALPPELNTGVPHTARVWNYYLGGKDNFAADREVAEQFRALVPSVAEAARADRAFLARVVKHVVAEQGIRQILDLGTGIPTADNTHEVAQRLAPETRVVYVDNDPIVLVHARALLTSTPEGVTDYVEADVRDPDAVLRNAARTLDLTQPTAVMMLGVLNHVEGDEVAQGIVRQVMAALPSGSYLALTHPTDEISGDGAHVAVRLWNENGGTPPLVLRSRDQLAELFTGLEVLEPGIVPPARWRPAPGLDLQDSDEFCGVGYKP